MKKLTALSLLVPLALGATALAPAAHAADAAPAGAKLTVIQALPDQVLDVVIDRGVVSEGSEAGSVLGPFPLAAGEHRVTFEDEAGEVVLSTTVDVANGSVQDLVAHLPAQVDGEPVATVYETPTSPIGSDKARVLIAHTASVAPADVRVDGTVVFTNIANGEFATADVPAGDHVAELLPAGVTRGPILGPLDVTLPASTATMIYAMGDPKQDSMEVIAHNVPLAADGADVPTSIDAGSAGLVSGADVTAFGTDVATTRGDNAAATYGTLGGLLLLALGLVHFGRRRFAVEDQQ